MIEYDNAVSIYKGDFRMSKQKLEKVLQLMINEENDKASQLLHDIFVEKARKIYSDMIKEDEMLERDLGDWEDDFEDDVSTKSGIKKIDDEIDYEEMKEAADEDEDEMDMDSDEDEMDMDSDEDEMDMDSDEDEMDMEMDSDEDEMDMEMDSDMEAPSADADEAFMNVEDALAELKAAFKELVGEEPTQTDEFADDEYEYEVGDEVEPNKIGESAVLKKEKVAMKDGSDGKASPVAKVKDNEKLGVPMTKAISTKEGSAAKVAKPKELGVPGPQDHGSKMKPAPRVKKD
jgi:hypothetical protein